MSDPFAEAAWMLRQRGALEFADALDKEVAVLRATIERMTKDLEEALAASQPALGWTLISERHFAALASALSEILATTRGESDQPILDIIEWCMKEIEASPPPRQGFAHPAPTRDNVLEEAAKKADRIAEIIKRNLYHQHEKVEDARMFALQLAGDLRSLKGGKS